MEFDEMDVAGSTVEGNTITGTDGNDGLTGSDGNDSIFGLAGNDFLESGRGNDYLVGGSGSDNFVFISGFEGHDTIADFEVGTDLILIPGGPGRVDTAVDGFAPLADSFIQDGDDALLAFSAAESVRFLNTQVDDLLVNGGPLNDGGTITITGTPQEDTINGTADNDIIFGEGGNDAILGNAGDDIIDSGTGNDYLVGGDGADVFVFNDGDGHDTIDGFEIGVDSLEIAGVRVDDLSDISELLSQDGQDVLIGFSAQQSIRLVNTSLDDVLNGVVDTPIDEPVDDPVDDGDIPGDSSTTATISVGQTIESTIAPSRDVDAFALSLEAGQNINISHEGGRQVTLQDADGNIVAGSFTFFRTGNFSDEDFVFQAEEADTYFLTVESFIPSSVSDDDLLDTPLDYSVTVTEFADDHGNFASNATPLSQGNNIIEGQFEHIEDSDAFAVFLTEGQILSLDLDGDIFRPTTTVLGPDGEDATGLVLDNVIGRSGITNREQQIVATEDGVYTIIVDSRNDFFDPTTQVIPENPDYTLTTSVLGDARLELDNDIGDTLDDATQILSSDTIVSEISSVDDTDVFAIDLTAGQTLSLSTVTDFAQTASILDADGNIVAEFPSTSFDNARRVFQSELDFTAEDSGTFFISITNDVDGLIDQLYFLEANIAGSAPANIVGTDGADTLVGTAGDDVISGAGGSDGIFGGAGDDIIDSGAGNDYLVGGDGADVFVFNDGDGHDTIADFAAALDSIEISGVRIDNLSDISELLSQDGNDVLIGLSAEQSIRLLDTTLDDVDDGTIEDVIDDGPTTDTVINGTNGNDALTGGTGDDTIDGGAGNDLLTGGAGDDVYLIAQGDGFDRISDFQPGEDVVDLTDHDFADFEELNLVQGEDNNVFLFIDETQSIEFTGIRNVSELTVDDFVL